jgi:hypothetical protein
MYAGSYGPQYLDLSWQPQSTVETPRDVRVLLDRMEPLGTGAIAYERAQPKTETTQTQINFFWAMAPIAAKYIARRDVRGAEGMLRLLQDTLHRAEVERRQDEQAAGPVRPVEQLRALRKLCVDMESAMARVDPGSIHDPRVPGQVRLFCGLVEQMLSEGKA